MFALKICACALKKIKAGSIMTKFEKRSAGTV
jgi:hypothetical protein